MRKFVASCSALLIAAGFLAACGGSSAKTGADTNDPTVTTERDGSDGDSTDLENLVGEASKERFKITYTNDSDDEQTYAQDGDGNSVFGDGDSKTFISKDATITCQKNDDVYECQQSPLSIGALGNPFTGILTLSQQYIRALGGRLGDTSSKEIAGRDAECVTFSAKDIAGSLGGAIADAAGKSLKGSATYCIDKETGVPLEVSSTDDDGEESSTIIVTKYEEPSDSEFEVPATPTTTPGISLPPGITLPEGIEIPGQ